MTGGGLALRDRYLLKVGQLYAGGGRWQDAHPFSDRLLSDFVVAAVRD